MTNSYTILEVALGSLLSLGALAGGLGYLYSQYSKGKKGESKDEIDTQNSLTKYLKTQIETYKQIAKEQDEKISNMGKEISAFRAVIEEKDKTINKYLEILQNRNPELEDTLKGIAESLVGIRGFMEHIDTHLEKSSKEMKIVGTVTQK